MADTYRPERRDRGRDRVSMSPRPASPPPATAARDRSPSPLPRRRAPPPAFAASRRRTPPPEPSAEQKQAAAQAEYNRLLNARSGGVYMPPARLRALQAQVQDKSSKEYQRMAWEALKKSINGLVNKATAANMRQIINELFAENLVRGRGLLTQSLIKAQYASTPFTAVYACIAACINSKLPAVGELLLRRLLLRFRKGFRRNDKAVCRSATTFLAHLVNTQVADEMIAAQMLLLLLHNPTDDSVEIAVNLTREVGNYLETMNPTVLVVVFDRFHYILNEADIDKRTQYAIEVLFQNRKDQFKDHPAVRDDLDLIEEEDQIKHMLELNGKFDDEATLNVFRYDEHWEENEKEYAKLRREILNESDSEDEDGDSSGAASGSDDGEDDDDGDSSSDEGSERAAQTALDIKDRTNADLVALRRTIYLTIQSSMNADEAVHKLLAVNLPEGREMELPSMVIECCSQEKTYTKFFGLIAERLAKLNRRWATLFEEAFAKYYETIHRYETNRLRNIACLFGHLLASNAIGWHVLSAIHLNEEETTSASRIFIKILFQETAEAMGMAKLRARLCNDVELRPSLEGLFPVDDARHLRFAINYFTSIGMGVLTEDMRERLQNLPKPAPPAAVAAAASDDDDDGNRSDSRSVSSYSSSYTGSSYSRTPSRSRSRSRSPYQRRKYDSRSPSRSRSRSTRSYTASRSPSRDRLPIRNNRAGKRGRSFSRSVSPAAPRRGDRGAATTSAAAAPPPPPPKAARRGRSSSYSSRSYSRSPSPPPAASAARKRTASPVRRGRSISPARRRRRRSATASPPAQPPPPTNAPASRRGRAASYSPSPSRSSLPRGRRSPSLSVSRSPSRSRSRSRSLTPVRARSPRDRSPRPPVPAAATGTRRRRRGDSASSTGSNAPRKKNRRSE